jgi:ABC-type Na+ efflux pump permease subunit
MFWLIVGAAVFLMVLSPFLPYFTFGEDYIMVKELGYDFIMLAAVLFGVIAASMSVSEEIEGRTAVTLMSKPVSRRQFLLGKFFGILLVCLVIVGVLGWLFQWVLLYKRWFDQLPPRLLSPGLSDWVNSLSFAPEGRHLVRGVLLWLTQAGEVLPGLVMSSSLVMVLVGLAVALATRVPLVVNLVTCLVVYFLANLMPVLVQTTRPTNPSAAGPVQKLLYFMAQLFDALLPGLELFRVRPTVIDETTLPVGAYLQHVAAVTGYGILFTAIVLLLGLVLFEDRDLA